MSQISDKIERLKNLRKEADQLEDEIDHQQRACSHRWGKPYRNHFTHKSYTIPAVKLGSDSTPEIYVPEKTDTWWERCCLKCEKIEKTTETKPTAYEPVF